MYTSYLYLLYIYTGNGPQRVHATRGAIPAGARTVPGAAVAAAASTNDSAWRGAFAAGARSVSGAFVWEQPTRHVQSEHYLRVLDFGEGYPSSLDL